MDRNPGDQFHLTRLEHSKVQVKTNQQSTERNLSTAAASATESAGTSALSVSPAEAALPSTSLSTIHANTTVKVEDESMSGQSVQMCKRVKKEEYDEEYVVVECDCEECIEKIKVEEEEEFERNSDYSVHRCTRVKKEEHSDGEFVKVEGDSEDSVKMEIKEEFEEVEVKDDKHDRLVKRLKTEQVDEDGLMHDDGAGDDAEAQEEGELIGGEQEGFGGFGHFENEQVNDVDQTNVIQEDAHQMDSQLQADIGDQIEVPHEQEPLESASIVGQSVQQCKRVKKEEEFDGEGNVMLHCECGCEEAIGKMEVKGELDESDEEEFERNSDQSVDRCTRLEKEEQNGECDGGDSVKMEIKEEFEEVEVKDDEQDRLVNRLKTEPVSDEEDGWMHDDRGGDAQDNEEGELIGGGGVVGFLDNVNQVNDADQTNVIQEDAHQMDSQLQADIAHQIDQVHHDQEPLSDIEYELKMLRNVFMKPIGNGAQFRCDYPKCSKRFGSDEQKLLAHIKLHTKPYFCDAVGCLRRFTSCRVFLEHKKSHSANVLQCDLPGCVKRFKYFGALNLHKRDHTDAMVFICEWGACEKVFCSESRYRLHLLTHSDDGIEERQLVCDLTECTRQFTTRFNLSIHRKLHTGPFESHLGPFQQVPLPAQPNFVKHTCDQCGADFAQEAHLVSHRLTHILKNPFACTVAECDHVCTSSSQLQNHLRVHSNRGVHGQVVQIETEENEDVEMEEDDDNIAPPIEPPPPPRPTTLSSTKQKRVITVSLECPQVGCGLMFANAKLLFKHLKETHSIGRYRCMVKDCGQSFTAKISLGQHVSQSHPSTTRWQCNKCERHFSSYLVLCSHNTQQHQLGVFQCSFAACTFTGEIEAKVYRHYAKQHNTQSMKNCDHPGCQYRTPNACDLEIHQRVHSGAKPFHCKWPNCDYAGRRRADTIEHIRRRHLAPNPNSDQIDAQLADPKDYVEMVQ